MNDDIHVKDLKKEKLIPPRGGQWFLLKFLREDLGEEVLGDLDEKFYSLASKRPMQAKLNYWYQVINYIRPFAIRKSGRLYLNSYDMFQNYFKIGWRNFTRQNVFLN